MVTSSLQSSELTSSLQDHLEECRAEEGWAEYSDGVISFITSHFPAWERREVERAAGILRTNAYCVEAGEQAEYGMVRVIYPLLSAMSVSQSVSQIS